MATHLIRVENIATVMVLADHYCNEDQDSNVIDTVKLILRSTIPIEEATQEQLETWASIDLKAILDIINTWDQPGVVPSARKISDHVN